MAWLFVDATFGLSGDMMLSSLIALGVDPNRLASELAQLIPDHFALTATPVVQGGIHATHLVVDCEEGHTHRHARDLMTMVETSALSERIKTRSFAIIDHLARAEARVHGIDPGEVSFHEVGAVDSIIDMIGTAIALEWLEIEGLIFSPPALGHGTVHCQHGLYPIPAPATAYLLEGVPLAPFDAEGELMTPTGAALLKALADSVGPFNGAKILAIGYGAGSRTYADHPNVVRSMIFEPRTTVLAHDHQHEHHDQVALLSANLDDLPAELMAHAGQALLAAGALDVWMDPVIMKKGRPGVVLNALASPDLVDSLAALFFRETSTLGVRIQGPFERRSLARHKVTVDLGYGTVDVKVGSFDGKVVQAAPEYETVARLSQAIGKPAKLIYQDVAAHLEAEDPA